MNRKSLIVLAVVLICVARAWTAAEPPTTAPSGSSATGTWTFTVRIQDLTVDSVAELKQSGATITGTVITGAATQPSTIKEGKISGQNVRFTVDRIQEQGTFEAAYAGRLDGDQIRGKAKFGWIDVPEHTDVTTLDWVANRVKDGSKPKPGVR